MMKEQLNIMTHKRKITGGTGPKRGTWRKMEAILLEIKNDDGNEVITFYPEVMIALGYDLPYGAMTCSMDSIVVCDPDGKDLQKIKVLLYDEDDRFLHRLAWIYCRKVDHGDSHIHWNGKDRQRNVTYFVEVPEKTNPEP